MGTSTPSKGPGSSTPLIPTWLDDEGPDTSSEQPNPANADEVDPNDDESNTTNPRPLVVEPDIPNRFSAARGNFTRFAASSGTDSQALGRALRDYVQSSSGGTSGAVRRMAPSRRSAAKAFGVINSFAENGVTQTLQQLNFTHLVGQPIERILPALVDHICGDGGSVDEAIARDAWTETVAWFLDGQETDTSDFSALDWRAAIEVFVANIIMQNVYQAIGVNALARALSDTAIESYERAMRGHIRGFVSDAFHKRAPDGEPVPSDSLNEIIDLVFEECIGQLESWEDDK